MVLCMCISTSADLQSNNLKYLVCKNARLFPVLQTASFLKKPKPAKSLLRYDDYCSGTGTEGNSVSFISLTLRPIAISVHFLFFYVHFMPFHFHFSFPHSIFILSVALITSFPPAFLPISSTSILFASTHTNTHVLYNVVPHIFYLLLFPRLK